jgi:hypothetical protein
MAPGGIACQARLRAPRGPGKAAPFTRAAALAQNSGSRVVKKQVGAKLVVVVI